MAIEDVLRRNEAALMRLPHVVSVGLGERSGEGVILIFLDRDPATLTREAVARYPTALEGHPVELQRAVNVGP